MDVAIGVWRHIEVDFDVVRELFRRYLRHRLGHRRDLFSDRCLWGRLSPFAVGRLVQHPEQQPAAAW